MTKRATSRPRSTKQTIRRVVEVRKIRIFISWSGDESKEMAGELKKFLGPVMAMGESWVSSFDIDAGAAWYEELTQALEEADFAVLCLTKSNRDAPWIHFEAGYLLGSKKMQVCPYLLDLMPAEIKGPLATRNARVADRSGTKDLLTSINNIINPGIPESDLNTLFENFWQKFEEALGKIKKAAAEKYAQSEQVISKSMESVEEFYKGAREYRRKEEEERPKQQAESVAESLRASKTARRKLGAGTFTLEVVNPSHYARTGHVAVPWEWIYKNAGIPPREVVIFDNAGNPLPTQVDLDDPNDPAHGTLRFSLRDPVPGRVEDDPTTRYLVHAARTTSSDEGQAGAAPHIEVETKGREKRRIRLINSRLDVRLELFPRPWEGDKNWHDKNWFAGAASSVLLLPDRKELLSAFEFDPYDYEKRCMQINELWLLSPVERPVEGEQTLIRQPYQYISQASGPVRASVKIASSPFDGSYIDPDTQKHVSLECRLYREISLYDGGDYLVEKLYVQSPPATAKGGEGNVDHPFKARYFTYADFGIDANKHHYIPNWLAINSDWPPAPGYGFAAKVPIHSFENPHPGFRPVERQRKSYSWVLSGSRTVECLHLFMYGKFQELRARVESGWYEVIEEPLRAQLPS